MHCGMAPQLNQVPNQNYNAVQNNDINLQNMHLFWYDAAVLLA